MLEFPKWKYALIAVVLLASVIYSLPNIYPQQPAVQISVNRGELETGLTGRVEALLKSNGITPVGVAIENGDVMVRLANPEDQIKAADIIRPELGARYTAALNLASTVPAWLSGLGAKPMTLGLDLQGGVHFLMQVDQQAALDKRTNAYAEEVRAALREAKITGYDVSSTPAGIRVIFNSEADRNKARTLLAKNFLTLTALDLPGDQGIGLNITLIPAEAKLIADGAVEQNINTLRNRIDSLGVSEPVIQAPVSRTVIVDPLVAEDEDFDAPLYAEPPYGDTRQQRKGFLSLFGGRPQQQQPRYDAGSGGMPRALGRGGAAAQPQAVEEPQVDDNEDLEIPSFLRRLAN